MQLLYLTPVFKTNLNDMRKILFMIMLIGTYGLVQAQESEVRSVGSFNGIKAAEGIDVYLKKGSKESVRVEVSGDTELSNVVTEVAGSYLKIHFRENRIFKKANAKVFVTYVGIDKISASSAANVYSDGVLKSNDLEIGTSSAASVEINVEVNTLSVSVSSAGNVELEGKAKSAQYETSSAGEIDAYDLEVERVVVEASSAGSVKLSVVNDLVANASSGGSIRYRGNPAKSVTNSSSGGSVKKSY